MQGLCCNGKRERGTMARRWTPQRMMRLRTIRIASSMVTIVALLLGFFV